MSLATQLAGWAGALGTAAAYGLVSRRWVAPDSATFQSLNLSGAALLAVSAAASSSWPAVAANSVWVLISVHALVGARRVLRHRRGSGTDHLLAGELAEAQPVA